MFKLVAEAHKQGFAGVVSSRSFDSVEAAEQVMRKWARFGVDGLCDEADKLCIYDEGDKMVRIWSRRQKQPIIVEA
jgi:hypothetical protein